VQIADGANRNYFLTTFGRAPRDTVCACEAKTEPTLSQALHMLNGNTIQAKVQQGAFLKRVVTEKKEPAEVIDRLYVRCLSRPPTADEREGLLEIVKSAPNVQQGLEDVFWAVLNSREFLFNH